MFCVEMRQRNGQGNRYFGVAVSWYGDWRSTDSKPKDQAQKIWTQE